MNTKVGIRLKKEYSTHRRPTGKQSEGEYNKPAIKDHINKKNHIIDWNYNNVIKVLEKEQKVARKICQAIWTS